MKLTEQVWRLIGALILIFVSIDNGLALDIDAELNDPVATSTANAGAPDDINIVSGGSIVIENGSSDHAIRVDSDNDVSNLNVIRILDADDSTGIYIEGGLTTSITSSGIIDLREDYTRVDLDDDGDLDGPLAIGTGRVGILLDGAGTMTGDINLGSFNQIRIEGRDSAAVRLDSPLQGSLINDSIISVLGDNSHGIDIRSGVTGNVFQSGSIQVQGANSIGVRLADGATGSFINESSISSTGFTSNLQSNYRDPDSIGDDDTPISELVDAEDLRSSGSAVSIGGSLGQGFLNNGIVDNFVDADEAADEIKDTVEDFDENRATGSITSVGDAPGILISPDAVGNDVGNVVIGRVVEVVRDTTDDDADSDFTETLATFNYDYGFINRGSVSVSGLNVGYSATALRIEGAPDGSRTVLVEGGIQNTRTISAAAFEGNATALSLGAYAGTDQLVNSGDIRASVSTNGTDQARAIFIETNARLNSINNAGGILALVNATDSGGVATAILDQSDTLTSILNQGSISAQINYLDADVAELGSAVAIDLSGHTQSVSILQSWLTPVDDLNQDGVIDQGDVSVPTILGDVLLGSGDDSLDLQGGVLTSALVDLGLGTDTLSISNGVVFRGGLAGVELLSIEDSVFNATGSGLLNVQQFDLLGDSELIFSLDTTADFSAPRLSSTGQALVEAGGTLVTQMEGPLLQQLDLQLIQAGALVWGDTSGLPTLTAPAIYDQAVTVTNTELHVALSTKSADTLGLTANEGEALSSFLALAQQNATLGTALTSYYDQQALVDAYNLLLPDYSDSVFRFLGSELSLVGSEIGARQDKLRAEEAGGWFDIGVSGFEQSANGAGVGFKGTATTLQMGFDLTANERFGYGLGVALRDGHGDSEKTLDQRTDWTVIDLGFYSSYHPGNWSWMAAANAGVIDRYSKRAVVFADIAENLESEWSGHFFSGSSKISYRANFAGRYFLAPTLNIDYLQVNQEGFTEESDVDSSLLAMQVGSGDASRLSGSAVLRIGRYDREFSGPEGVSVSTPGIAQQAYVGYRSELNSTAFEARANFLVDSTNSFDLSNPYASEDALIFGANFDWSPEGSTLISLGYSGEASEDFVSHKVFFELRIFW